ncbi:MAG: pantoate--beta-alanine ligase [Bacteroidales bacterium]
MKTIYTTAELQTWREEQRLSGIELGFVPTMGALHQGHMSLVEMSVAENGMTACSIFVNPIQFNNPEDLKRYPRMPEKDLKMLESAGCDMVFLPSVEEMYPEPVARVYDFGHLDKVMEGAFRPGHFNGVAVVVHRLFELVDPDRAYFGLKDYQQLMIIREMVKQEGHRVEVTGCPIIREADGLAMSSRNLRLTPEQRAVAPEIHAALQYAAGNYQKHGTEELKTLLNSKLAAIPGARPEYVEMADAETLLPVSHWEANRSCILCVAVYLGDIRLIDNIILY